MTKSQYPYFFKVFRRPFHIDEKTFVENASKTLQPYTEVRHLRPVRLANISDEYFIVQGVTKTLDDFGYETVFDNLTLEEVRNMRQMIETGKKTIFDFKKELIYENNTFFIHSNIYIPDFNEINSELIAYLAKKPELMHKLHWRKFEELLNELFKAKGYETELGPGSGDGGVDIRMVTKSGLGGSFMTLVQAKKYSEKNKIALAPVQALYGTLEYEKATSGLFVTTSTYAPCARNFAESIPHRLELADKDDIRVWLKQYSEEIGQH